MSNLDSKEVKMQTELYKLGVQNEQLKAEVERLKQESLSGIELAKIAIVLQQNERLRQALRKCSPLCIEYIDNDRYTQFLSCEFCGKEGWEDVDHADDCEYVRLTKEDKPCNG